MTTGIIPKRLNSVLNISFNPGATGLSIYAFNIALSDSAPKEPGATKAANPKKTARAAP
jgi:hypothetical protein